MTGVIYLERSANAEPFTEEQYRTAALVASQIAAVWKLLEDQQREVLELQARINPTFLHNAFSVIAQLATADGTKAEEAILMLSRLYRYMLAWSPERIVTLDQEVNMSRDYLALEKFRLGDRMRFELQLDGPLDRVHVPCLLLQTLIENSVSQGLATKMGGGSVTVAVLVDATHCVLRIEDDGLGWADRSEPSEPLRLLKQRLDRHYPRCHTLRVRKSDGLEIEIRIPRTRSLASTAER